VKFSIIIPSLNQGRFIDRAIASVYENAERLKGWNAESCVEILVMDGGSNDGTIPILEEWSNRVKRWESAKVGKCEEGKVQRHEDGDLHTFAPSYFHTLSLTYVSERDGGQTDAINKGLARASGDILAYLCADDFYEPGALAAVAQVFADHPEVDLVYGDGYFLEGDSGWKRLKRTGECPPERLKMRNPLMQPTVFWKRRVYERFGGFDESLRYVMDNEYWLRICDQTEWFYLVKPLATAQMHPGAKTSSGMVKMWDEAADVAERYGIGDHYRRIARGMRYGGALVYRSKRLLLRVIGKWVAKNH